MCANGVVCVCVQILSQGGRLPLPQHMPPGNLRVQPVLLAPRYSSAADAVGHPGTVTDKLGSTLDSVRHTVTDATGSLAHQVWGGSSSWL